MSERGQMRAIAIATRLPAVVGAPSGRLRAMRMQAFLLVVIVACTVAPTPTAPATSLPPATTSAVTSVPATTVPAPTTTVGPLLPTNCAMDEAFGAVEVTFVIGISLYGVAPDGTALRCLANLGTTPTNLAWSPSGDRVLVDETIMSAGQTVTLPKTAVDAGWTRPTGQGVFYLADDGLHKWKNGTDDRISFLTAEDVAAYHPAGTHIAVIGTEHTDPELDPLYGLWLSTNLGEGADLIASDQEAILSSPAFDAEGLPLFVAHHGDDHWDIHRVIPVPEGGLEITDVNTGDQPMGLVTPSVFFTGDIAWVEGSEGECTPEAQARILGVESPQVGHPTLPLAWSAPGVLVVMDFVNGCDQPFDLLTWTVGPEVTSSLVFSAVDVAALRLQYPDPPPPPSRNFSDSTAPA